MKRGFNLIARHYLRYGFCEKDAELETVKNCVYFISDGTYTKIGIATDLKKRLSGLQTSNARELKAICAILCKSKREMEKYEIMLHKRFKEKNVRGEWFWISPDDIKSSKLKAELKCSE